MTKKKENVTVLFSRGVYSLHIKTICIENKYGYEELILNRKFNIGGDPTKKCALIGAFKKMIITKSPKPVRGLEYTIDRYVPITICNISSIPKDLFSEDINFVESVEIEESSFYNCVITFNISYNPFVDTTVRLHTLEVKVPADIMFYLYWGVNSDTYINIP